MSEFTDEERYAKEQALRAFSDNGRPIEPTQENIDFFVDGKGEHEHYLNGGDDLDKIGSKSDDEYLDDILEYMEKRDKKSFSETIKKSQADRSRTQMGQNLTGKTLSDDKSLNPDVK